jgi:hypothetical protein
MWIEMNTCASIQGLTLLGLTWLLEVILAEYNSGTEYVFIFATETESAMDCPIGIGLAHKVKKVKKNKFTVYITRH